MASDETRRIQVVPYRRDWPARFQEEAKRLRGILGQEVVAIHHIGSTAIPSISAKPIVDILVEVQDITRIDGLNEAMIERGYRPQGAFGIPGRRFFIKGEDARRTHHVHVFQTGHPRVDEHVWFRDYMVAHPAEARAYGRLKKRLAAQFPEDIEGYVAGKDGFIEEINQKAREWKRREG